MKEGLSKPRLASGIFCSKDEFELIFLLASSKCWDCRHVPSIPDRLEKSEVQPLAMILCVSVTEP